MEWASPTILIIALMHHFTSIQTIPSEPLRKLDILPGNRGREEYDKSSLAIGFEHWPLWMIPSDCIRRILI